jgi:hypothetical protein
VTEITLSGNINIRNFARQLVMIIGRFWPKAAVQFAGILTDRMTALGKSGRRQLQPW